MKDLDCAELGLCKIWIMEDFDHVRFGSRNVKNVLILFQQNLYFAKIGLCKVCLANLINAKFGLCITWIAILQSLVAS